MRRAVFRPRNDRLTWLAIVAAMLSAPVLVLIAHSEARAASTTITAYSSGSCTNCWQPANVTVNIGDQVTWAMGNGPHGLEKLQSGSAWPAGCPADGTYGSCSFSQAGTYNYQCSVHKAAMMGSVTVSGPPPPPPSSQPAAAPPPPPVPQVGHQAPAAQPAPSAAQPAPSQSQALPSPSPSPSDTSQALTSPPGASPRSGGLAADTSRATPRGGPGPLPFIIGVAVLAALAGGVVYFVRTRNPANPAP